VRIPSRDLAQLTPVLPPEELRGDSLRGAQAVLSRSSLRSAKRGLIGCQNCRNLLAEVRYGVNPDGTAASRHAQADRA
jgi:hypothetical protein